MEGEGTHIIFLLCFVVSIEKKSVKCFESSEREEKAIWGRDKEFMDLSYRGVRTRERQKRLKFKFLSSLAKIKFDWRHSAQLSQLLFIAISSSARNQQRVARRRNLLA
jgi:hypothetical protein